MGGTFEKADKHKIIYDYNQEYIIHLKPKNLKMLRQVINNLKRMDGYEIAKEILDKYVNDNDKYAFIKSRLELLTLLYQVYLCLEHFLPEMESDKLNSIISTSTKLQEMLLNSQTRTLMSREFAHQNNGLHDLKVIFTGYDKKLKEYESVLDNIKSMANGAKDIRYKGNKRRDDIRSSVKYIMQYWEEKSDERYSKDFHATECNTPTSRASVFTYEIIYFAKTLISLNYDGKLPEGFDIKVEQNDYALATSIKTAMGELITQNNKKKQKTKKSLKK